MNFNSYIQGVKYTDPKTGALVVLVPGAFFIFTLRTT